MKKYNLRALLSYEIKDFTIDEDIIFKKGVYKVFGSNVEEGFYKREYKYGDYNELLFEGLPEGRVHLFNDSSNLLSGVDVSSVYIKPSVVMCFGYESITYYFNSYKEAKEFESSLLVSDFVQVLPSNN